MRFRGWHAFLILVIATAVVLFLSGAADAQCSMCRAALTGSDNARLIRNFDLAVVVLLVPPVSIFCTIFVLLRKHKDTDG